MYILGKKKASLTLLGHFLCSHGLRQPGESTAWTLMMMAQNPVEAHKPLSL